MLWIILIEFPNTSISSSPMRFLSDIVNLLNSTVSNRTSSFNIITISLMLFLQLAISCDLSTFLDVDFCSIVSYQSTSAIEYRSWQFSLSIFLWNLYLRINQLALSSSIVKILFSLSICPCLNKYCSNDSFCSHIVRGLPILYF